MILLRKTGWSCALVVVAAACNDGRFDTAMESERSPPVPAEDVPSHSGDQEQPTHAQTPIPLELWVDDLIEHHTTDQSLPDSVRDKKISDTQDHTLFDKYFMERR